jgi:hypothetical protein
VSEPEDDPDAEVPTGSDAPTLAHLDAIIGGGWECTEVRGEIERQLKVGDLRSVTGSVRTNDKTEIWRPYMQ